MSSTVRNRYIPVAFLKFGREEHIRDLYENGTIYMNSLQVIRNYDQSLGRGDKYEGIEEVINQPKGVFEIPSIKYKGNYEKIHLRKSSENVLGNIYCLYAISGFGFSYPSDFFIDERMKSFGSHVLFIKDWEEFLSRVKSKLQELPFQDWTKFVNYYNKDLINGEITVFQKRSELEYQKEFRIYIDRREATPFSFQIGSLKQISEVYQSDQIIKHLRISVE